MNNVICLKQRLNELKESHSGARYKRYCLNEIRIKSLESYSLLESFLADNNKEREEEMEKALKSFKDLNTYLKVKIRKLDDDLLRKKEILNKWW